MKASELIIELAKAIKEHGDIPVIVYHERYQEHRAVDGTIVREEEYRDDSVDMTSGLAVEITY